MRIIGKLLALAVAALLLSVALAEEEPALPQGVTALLASAHPDMTVAAYDGWENEARGQFAVAMTDGQRYTLCMAEKAEGDAAYALTVDNPRALREGETPSLLIDTGGDALFIDYYAPSTQEEGFTWYGGKDSYDFVKGGDGRWNFLGVEHYDSWRSDYACITSYTVSVNDGGLSYVRYSEDENGNILERRPYAVLPVSEAYASRLALDVFDADLLATTPEYGIRVADGLCEGLLEEGDALLQVDLKESAVVMLVEKPGGARRLRVTEPAGTVRETGDLPEQATLDSFHAGADSILLNGEMGFDLLAGRWALSWLWSEENMRFGPDWVGLEVITNGRNDGCIYGEHPWGDLFEIDFATLPHTFDEALAQMDTSVYALVNNPDPEDRLHLRAKPDRNAESLGKFYNRTPVRLLGVEGDWAHVRIGREGSGLEGYMMTRYLAFGGDAQGVESRFPVKQLLNEAGEAMLTAPREGAPERPGGPYTGRNAAGIIGVVGDTWYVVMRTDGSVGYIKQSAFWDGNG